MEGGEGGMPFITVITCTYNRLESLSRLYLSLRQQTFKDFVWLILDDGSTDGVGQQVRLWQQEGCLDIDYHHFPHRGKHWTQKDGWALVKTCYTVEVDDDDELTDDGLEVLHQTWCQIEREGRDDIGMVAALSEDEKGNVICYDGWKGDFLDTDYLAMEWTAHHPSENLLSMRSDIIQKVGVYRDEGKWLYDQVTLVLESVLWNRIAEKYHTRYIKKVLRVYHCEGQHRLSKSGFGRQKCINYTFSLYVLLNELQGRYCENVHDTLKYLAEYLACGTALKYPVSQLVRSLNSRFLRVGGILLSPAAFLVGGYFRTHYFK